MLAKSMHAFMVLYTYVKLSSRNKLTAVHSNVSTSMSLYLKRQQYNNFRGLCSFFKEKIHHTILHC